MTDYTELVNALRICSGFVENPSCSECDYSLSVKCRRDMMHDAAAAIEALQADVERLQAQLPKRGEWELIDGAEPMRWGCSRCKYLSWETSNYCPRCGAKMEVQE